ncbi:MAG: PilZ domain-containing protein [Spirochaetaceae bacterium]|jgi:hypothetical protein|nr:PilZ domain-containing protein [Spirochaetaceae bacterium]
MNEKRHYIRYAAKGIVTLPGEGGSDYTLKDISICGCCIRYSIDRAAAFEIMREYQITVIPEPEALIESFDLRVEPCWIREIDGFCEVGCFITGYPGGKLYQRFADYLARQASLA